MSERREGRRGPRAAQNMPWGDERAHRDKARLRVPAHLGHVSFERSAAHPVTREGCPGFVSDH
jgi:hypothetical protein